MQIHVDRSVPSGEMCRALITAGWRQRRWRENERWVQSKSWWTPRLWVNKSIESRNLSWQYLYRTKPVYTTVSWVGDAYNMTCIIMIIEMVFCVTFLQSLDFDLDMLYWYHWSSKELQVLSMLCLYACYVMFVIYYFCSVAFFPIVAMGH